MKTIIRKLKKGRYGFQPEEDFTVPDSVIFYNLDIQYQDSFNSMDHKEGDLWKFEVIHSNYLEDKKTKDGRKIIVRLVRPIHKLHSYNSLSYLELSKVMINKLKGSTDKIGLSYGEEFRTHFAANFDEVMDGFDLLNDTSEKFNPLDTLHSTFTFRDYKWSLNIEKTLPNKIELGSPRVFQIGSEDEDLLIGLSILITSLNEPGSFNYLPKSVCRALFPNECDKFPKARILQLVDFEYLHRIVSMMESYNLYKEVFEYEYRGPIQSVRFEPYLIIFNLLDTVTNEKKSALVINWKKKTLFSKVYEGSFFSIKFNSLIFPNTRRLGTLYNFKRTIVKIRSL